MSRTDEEVKPSALRVGDVAVFDDGTIGVVVGITAPMSARRADAGELAFRVRTPSGETSTPFDLAPLRRMLPVAADQWMQANLRE